VRTRGQVLGFGYCVGLRHQRQRALELNQQLRRSRGRSKGTTSGRSSFRCGVIVYTSRKLKEKAEEEAIPHIRYFFEDALRTTPRFLSPPGYLSVDQLKKRAALADKLHGGFNFEAINESFFVAVGTADQVVEKLEEWGEAMGTNHFHILGAIGNMTHWKVVKNLSLLAQDVIPRMRARAGAERRVAAE
jgi:alkanesulfonate monooxygenase SsuD/methylene tetrahydromethanopterin reductase-like flavin-dependent oxidoreductase (luciferase family)